MNNITNVGVIGSPDFMENNALIKRRKKAQNLVFVPTKAGEYTWKFWAGRNNDQSSKYVEVTVTVPEKKVNSLTTFCLTNLKIRIMTEKQNIFQINYTYDSIQYFQNMRSFLDFLFMRNTQEYQE